MFGFLKCRVSKGMFSDELVIVLTLENGDEFVFVVQSSDVKNVDSQGNGAVKVWIHTQENDRWAMLPTQQRDSVHFKESDLIPA